VSEASENANALQAIGAYMCAYSEAAYELGETLKVLFDVKDNAMADAIIAVLGRNFAGQADLARFLCQDARNADGTELSKERKERIDRTISDCFECNNDRVKIAHGRLEPRADGSVAIVYVKVGGGEVKGKEPIIWSSADWAEKTKKLTELADELRNFQKELKTIKIQVPPESTLGWLSTSNWDEHNPIFHRRRMAPVLEAALSGSGGGPPFPNK
jgi:hypothetical protein